MGTIINAIGTYKGTQLENLNDMISVSAEECLSKAKVDFSQVDLLINTSIYNEKYLSEPALASILQNTFNHGRPANNQFSFDISNGLGGTINAFQVVDNFIRSNMSKYALIVSGDIFHDKETEKIKYKNGAGAVLLSQNPDIPGFIKFDYNYNGQKSENFSSFLHWKNGIAKVNEIVKEDFFENCISFSAECVLSFLEKNGLKLDDLESIICSEYPLHYENRLHNYLGFKQKSNDSESTLQKSSNYSSGLLYELEKYEEELAKTNSRNYLFVCVSPGITVSLTLYNS